MKNILLLGGSSGIGLELLKIWLLEGHNVVIASRSATTKVQLITLDQEYTSLHLLDMDVSDFKSVVHGVYRSSNLLSSIDLCFYNAGLYEKMDVKNWNIHLFEKINDVNYMGAVRVMDAILPLFEKQGYGQIVCNVSIASYFGLPYGGAYSAPKAALLNLCESLQPELMAKNIKLQVINHGFVKTRLTAKNDFTMPQLLEPEVAAKIITKEIQNPYRFEIKFPFGLTAFLTCLRMLPYSIAFSLTRKAL